MRSKEKIAKFMKSLYKIKENQYFWGALALLYVVVFFFDRLRIGLCGVFKVKPLVRVEMASSFVLNLDERWISIGHAKLRLTALSIFLSDLDFVRPCAFLQGLSSLKIFPEAFRWHPERRVLTLMFEIFVENAKLWFTALFGILRILIV